MEDPYPYNAKEPTELTLVRALSAIGMVGGALALATLSFLVLRLLWTADAARPGQVPVDNPGPDFWFELAASLAGCGLAIMLLTASAAAIRFRSWARPLMIIYGLGSVIVGGVSAVFHIHWLILVNQNGSAIGLPQSMRTPEAGIEWICWLFGTVLGIAVLYAMTRPGVKLAFAEGGDTPHNAMAAE